MVLESLTPAVMRCTSVQGYKTPRLHKTAVVSSYLNVLHYINLPWRTNLMKSDNAKDVGLRKATSNFVVPKMA